MPSDDSREMVLAWDGSGGGGGGAGIRTMVSDGRGGGGGGMWPELYNTLAGEIFGRSLEDRLEEVQDEENSLLNSASERNSPGYVKESSEE